MFFGHKSSQSHSIRLLASENLPEWKLSEGYSLQTQIYIWGSRIKQGINIARRPTEGEKQVKDFKLGPCCSTETLLRSAILHLLEGITRDWYIPVSWLGNRETGSLCV